MLRLDVSVETLEIDFSVPRMVQIIPINSKDPEKRYILKITAKGGAILV